MEKQTSDQELKKKVEALLERDRAMMLFNMPFIGTIAMQLQLKAVNDDRCKTAMTDYKSIFFSCDFYKSLSEGERLFVLAHEVWHNVLFHIGRQRNRSHDRWNYAADLEIHFILQNELQRCGMKEPWVLDHETDWNGKSAEEIYELLPEQEVYITGDQHCNDGSSSGNESSDSTDGESKDGGGKNDPDFNPQAITSSEQVEKLGEEIRAQVVKAAQKCEMMKGDLPAYIVSVVEKYKTSKVNWRILLRNFVMRSFGGDRKWLPPNRRYISQGFYFQSRSSEKFTGVIAIDTSGSIDEDKMSRFITEACAAMRAFGQFDVTVIFCDAEIQKVMKLTQNNRVEADMDKRYGWGGTSFVPVFDYITEKKLCPNCLLYFTDLYGTFPETKPKYPVMWIDSTDGDWPVDVPFGTVVKIDNGD